MNALIKKAVDQSGSQQSLALSCGVTQAAVHKWMTGKSRPSALNAKAIERATFGEVKAAQLLPEVFD